MNINTGEIRQMAELTKEDIDSGFWHKIEKKNEINEASKYIAKKENVNLHGRSPLSNAARNKRKKLKKMSQKSKVKNRSK